MFLTSSLARLVKKFILPPFSIVPYRAGLSDSGDKSSPDFSSAMTAWILTKPSFCSLVLRQ
jgi:hypothetical protein